VDSKLDVFYEKGLSRRNFLVGAGALGAASTLAGCGDNSTPTPVSPPTTTYTDVDILNFALNLEYLEASFYLNAATGSGLIAADMGTGAGTVTGGGAKVPTTSTAQQNIINEIAYDEQQHVRFLRSALGSAAVPMPNINLTAGFSGAVTAANSLSPASATLPLIPTAFNPFGSFDQFVVGAYVFEDVGVTAYNGAAPAISAAGIASGYLTAAAGILGVEAYHAAYCRTYLTAQSIIQGTAAYPYAQYANRISALRAALGSGGETTLVTTLTSSVVPVTATSATVTPTSIVAATSGQSLAYARTTSQVLHIVYGTFAPTPGVTTPAPGVTAGGFFPSGMNGNIKITLT
jgi:Ferritin-like domain/TAT (twin-arginine translocation) pathway signal sequence